MLHRTNAPFERYLARVAAQLRALDAGRRAALLAELRTHLADAAAAAGRDADDSAFQQLVIDKLGPARRVGRELAVANELPLSRPSRWLLYGGAFGALLIPLWVLAFLGNAASLDEGRLELALIVSQVALLPISLALRLLCRAVAPSLSDAIALVGVLGAAAIPGNYVLSFLVRPPMDDLLFLLWRLWTMAWLSLIGGWALLVSGLLLARNRLRYPDAPLRDPLLGPALLGPGWGLAWIITMTNLADQLRWVPYWLLNLAFPAWLIFHLAWCLWVSTALVLTARRGPPAVPAAR